MPLAIYRITAAPVIAAKQEDGSVTTKVEPDFGKQLFAVAANSSEALKKAAAHLKAETPVGVDFAGMEVFQMEVVVSEFGNDGTVILK